jgi:hypothetical protein
VELGLAGGVAFTRCPTLVEPERVTAHMKRGIDSVVASVELG